MSGEQKKKLRRILAAAALLIGAWLFQKTTEHPLWVYLLVYLVPYLLAGYDVLLEAGENILHGDFLDEDFLMCIATIGALAIGFLPDSEPEFTEAVMVMLLYQVGELFEDIAEGKSQRSISRLMDIRPDTANVERDGEIAVVDPRSVRIGETIVIKPGEKVPMDGVVLQGNSSLDTAALTGESRPQSVREGEEILSGCVNLSGLLRVRVTKEFGESTASKILDLVQNAGENKSRSEKFIERFAKVYTPIVVFSAVALALVPPLAGGDFSAQFPIWLKRALTFLVVSCPCALVISIPLTYFSGIGAASRKGILIKGSNYLEALSHAGIVVFDKTGTLTRGTFRVTAVHPQVCSETELLHIAAHVERYSTHPIALSLREAYPDEKDDCEVSDVKEIAGRGCTALVNGKKAAVGNMKLMESVGAKWRPCSHAGTIIHVAIDGEYAGHIVISDEIKKDSKEAIDSLRREGVRRCVMLTGDREEVAGSVAQALGIDEYHAELLPQDKVKRVEELLQQKRGRETLAFVGDGMNDAPVLAMSDVGIAMGAMGSDAAIEAADVVLMDDQPSKIAEALRISRRTNRIATQNVVFAIAVKIAILVLSAFGLASMGMAVFGDVGVLILAVLNAMRAMR